jgi:hypothetical protein
MMLQFCHIAVLVMANVVYLTAAFQQLQSTSIDASRRYSSSLTMTAPRPSLIIGTRGSPLALAQAHETKRLIERHFPKYKAEGAIDIKTIMTTVQSSHIEYLHTLTCMFTYFALLSFRLSFFTDTHSRMLDEHSSVNGF